MFSQTKELSRDKLPISRRNVVLYSRRSKRRIAGYVTFAATLKTDNSASRIGNLFLDNSQPGKARTKKEFVGCNKWNALHHSMRRNALSLITPYKQHDNFCVILYKIYRVRD